MDTKTVTLTDFLLARIAEDEWHARRFLPGGPPWLNRPDAQRIAECEAKRRIVELHHAEAHGPGFAVCAECDGMQFPCRTLRALALPYADHPDYRDEWRP